MKKIIALFLIAVFVGSNSVPTVNASAKVSFPFYIVPMIEGIDIENNADTIKRLKNFLDSLEPKGADGLVRVGYKMFLVFIS